MENSALKGTGVALVTPFHEDRSIDLGALKALLNKQIGHVNFFVLLGSTSEAATLSDDEKWALVEFALAHISKRAPVIVGETSNDTNALVKRIGGFNFENIDGLLSAAPFYNKPSQKGIYEHFSAVANASPVPLILYNIPGRTGANIEADTILQLANDFRNIVAVKESSGNIKQISKVIANRPPGFKVFSGDDDMTLPLLALGADGMVSVSTNAHPKPLKRMVDYALEGDFQSAREVHYNMLEMMDLLFAEGNPAGVKANLTAQGLIKNVLRLPLTPVSDALYKKIEKKIADIAD